MSQAVKVLSGLQLPREGGPANCCGVFQFRAGDLGNAGRIGVNTVEGFAATGVSRVLTWCPTCNIQLGEVAPCSFSGNWRPPP
jgi:heterodisulfide reductase subunit D